jgi:hypothetical protein
MARFHPIDIHFNETCLCKPVQLLDILLLPYFSKKSNEVSEEISLLFLLETTD